jgi:uncharacterized protein YndB with AHSA1/START domain
MAHSLTIKRVLDATPEQVFKAWTDPSQMKKWLSPENLTVRDAVSENKVGGKYEVAMYDETKDQVHKAVGEFKTYEPNKSFSVTWNWEGLEAPETLLSIELTPRGESETEITLTHSGFPVQAAADEHKKGWESTLNNFEKNFK